MIDTDREIKTKRHYHVLSGLRGYVPNTNDTYATRKAAEAGARWRAKTFREDNWDTEPEYQKRVTGSARNDWYNVGEYEYISINPCYDNACVCQECGELLPWEGEDIHRC